MNKLLIAITSIIMTQVAIAVPKPGHWECRAFDANKRSYSAQATQLTKAVQAAYDKCRKVSKRRATCQTAQSYCEQGPLSLIDNRCIVSDASGKMFNTTGVAACRTAMTLCTESQFGYGSRIGTPCMVRHR